MKKQVKNVLYFISAICILYFFIIVLIIGLGSLFNYIYLIVGIILVLTTFYYEKLRNNILYKIYLIILSVCFIVFVCVEALIIYHSFEMPKPNADYVIILGSQTKSDGPSRDYRSRLNKGYEYLINNPHAKVITTGGKGSNEIVSEGQAGKDYLIDLGIDEKRIIIEENSFSTLENLINVKEMIPNIIDSKIVIASGNYHLFRAKYLAKKIGFKDISGTGGCGLLVLLPHSYIREFFALIKAFIL